MRNSDAWLDTVPRRTLLPAERGRVQIAAGPLERVAAAEVASDRRSGPTQVSADAEGAAPAP
ncbi:hypothetical protein OG194_43090 [Streptomyces sp. NBC_01288]|uniref:hypothetical protein n=1 Tax=Streptomyces sp. NBC_01288 TaxID=2903814 RepID=UPI002E14AA7E|nr:hypothetical protein OG194_43090 [Streptomyces sp. NBC_01288]